MELVYLWVEEYKNIKDQGFNFSSEFTYSYEKGNLIIDNSDNSIDNFFGENINITAIVGKNGSGKSNVLECIINKNKINKTYFYVTLEENDFKLYLYRNGYLSTVEKIELNKTYNIEKIPKKITNAGKKDYGFNSIFFTSLYHNLTLHDNDFTKNHKDISTAYLIYEYSKDKKINYKYQYNLYKSYTIKNVIHMLKDSSIDLPFNKPNDLNINVNEIYIENETEDKFLKKLKEFREKEQKETKFYTNILENALYFVYELDEEKFNDILKENIDNIIDLYKKFKEIDKDFFESIDTFLSFVKKYTKDKDYTTFLLSLKLQDIDNKFIDSIIDMSTIFDILHFNWKPELSTGQESFIFQFANFYYILKDIQKTNILVLVDEGETTMHPDWQKNYIKWIIDFFKNNFTDKKFHIILTSHSPFLLSDIPKQNIIFLDKDKEENCKVVDGLKDKKQTFGANIHTLLSDGFFMNDGLMGEFAKSKINDVIDFLHNKPSSISDKIEAENIIKIIGEPFIRDKLLQMYAEKFHADIVDIKIKNLEKQIEELKNAKNNNR
jgi:predicted ATPase